jgi:MscS family membrane protein
MNWFTQILNGLVADVVSWASVIDPGRILAFLAVIILFWLFRRGFASLTVWGLRVACRVLGIEISKNVETSIRPAAQLFVVSLGFLIGFKILSQQGAVAAYANKIVLSVLVASIFSGLYATCDLLGAVVKHSSSDRSEQHIVWVNKAARVVTAFVGVAAVLKVWGLDIGPLLTGMGVAGAAVALAAQDLFKNLLAGITNVSERRFRVGDWILVEGVVEGHVENMDFRSTSVRRFDKALVHVPNADLANASMINFSSMTCRRIYWKINITYRTTTKQLSTIRSAIEKFISESEDFVQPPEARRLVRIDALSDSSIEILVYCFTRATELDEYKAAQERLALEIKKIVSDSGSKFAFPSRSLYVEEALDAAPDEFVPQKKRKP